MKNLDLCSFGSSVGLVVGHLGFCPKYRHKIFSHGEIKARFVELCNEVQERHNRRYRIRIRELGIIEDHVHMAVESGMDCSPSKLAQLFKGYTSRKLLEEFPWLRQKYFWGGSLWTKSHYYASTGVTDYNTVSDYIKRQKEHHDKTQTKITSFTS